MIAKIFMKQGEIWLIDLDPPTDMINTDKATKMPAPNKRFCVGFCMIKIVSKEKNINN